MKKALIFFLILNSLISVGEAAEDTPLKTPNKTVLLAILARNKAHALPRYLKCIENQDYPKNLITIYINTNNNIDNTQEILSNWAKENKEKYKAIIFEEHNVSDISQTTDPHDWNSSRFKTLALIRNKSMRKAKEHHTDFYFVVDCDNFIAPFTLSDLVSKDKPIIGPLLRCIPEPKDVYANFFCDIDDQGYYKEHPDYFPILKRRMVGSFKVPVVHCTYLVKSENIDKLDYIDETDDYEFVIFSRTARNNHIDQYITNEEEYGVQIHFLQNVSLEEEKNRLEAILTIP